MHTVFWLGNLKGRKRPFGRSRPRWDNIRMVLREMGCGLDSSG